MDFKPTVQIDPDDIVRYLLYQQFYYGDDLIWGRTKDLSVLIPGAELTINAFYDLITKKIDILEEYRVRDYLAWFNQAIIPINTEKIMETYDQQIAILEGEDRRNFLLMCVVGGCLSEIHTNCFQYSIKDLIKNVNQKLGPNNQEREKLNDKIHRMYSLGNPRIGLLY